MLVQFKESVAGTPVYNNPHFVVSVRPDLVDPGHVTAVTVSNGDPIQVVGGHEEVAERLARPT